MALAIAGSASSAVTHRVLELTASGALQRARVTARANMDTHNLSQYALTPQLFDRQRQGGELMELTLTCETGRWILAAKVDAKNELAISRVEAGEVKNYVIDRTFLDDREEVMGD